MKFQSFYVHYLQEQDLDIEHVYRKLRVKADKTNVVIITLFETDRQDNKHSLCSKQADQQTWLMYFQELHTPTQLQLNITSVNHT